MVVIEKYTSTDIGSLPPTAAQLVYDETLNIIRFNNSGAEFSNVIAAKNLTNDFIDVNDINTGGSVGVNVAAGSTVAQLDVNSTTGACLRLIYNGTTNLSDLNVTATGQLLVAPSSGLMGVNAASPVKALDVNSATGACLRLLYNDSSNLADLSVSATGQLLVAPSSGLMGVNAASPVKALDVNSATGACLRLLYNDSSNLTDLSVTATGQLLVAPSSGLMGVNAANPVKALDVNSATGACLRLLYNDSSNLTDLSVTATGQLLVAPSSGLVGINATSPVKALDVNSTTGACLRLIYNSTSNLSDLSVSSSGQLLVAPSSGLVGVNTTNPLKTFEINAADGACLRLASGAPNGGASFYSDIGVTTDGQLTFTPSSGYTVDVGKLGVNTTAAITGQLEVNSATGACVRLTCNNIDGGTIRNADLNVSSAGKLNILTYGNGVGINTSAPDKQLEVNSATGACLRLTYNDADGTATYYTDFDVSAAGNLTLTPIGGAMFNAGKLGVNRTVLDKQVEINSTTGDCLRLNYNNAAGAASVYGDITVSSAGLLTFASSATKVYNNAKLGVNRSVMDSELEVNNASGKCIRLNYNNTAGVASVYADIDISSAGKLNIITTGNGVGINTTAAAKQLEVANATGQCLRLSYDDGSTYYTDLLVGANGNLSITPSSSACVDITTHNGNDKGLMLGGVLVHSTAAELDYTNVTTVGTAEASKALVTSASNSIIGINNLEASSANILAVSATDNTLEVPFSIMTVPHTSGNLVTAGLGAGMSFNLVNAVDAPFEAGFINCISSNVGSGTESAYFEFKLINAGVHDTVCTLSNAGVLTTTTLVETSDVRVKENIAVVPEEYSLSKILDVQVKSYNYTFDDEKKTHTGVIAQEIQKLLPEVVETSKQHGLDDFCSVHYSGLIGHLVNSIKCLQKEIDELKAKLE